MGGNIPAADVVVDESVVRALLAEQHPDLAQLPIVEFANGWDNVMFRLGDDLLARMPRRELAGRLVANEIAVLPELAPTLPLRVPAPVRSGSPTSDYPYVWAVLPWIEGRQLADRELADPIGEARRLGEFLAALHRPAPADAPANPFRGQHIGENDAALRERVTGASALLDDEIIGGSARVLDRWMELVDVEPSTTPAMWLHGDLHPLNVLEDAGQIVAVVDWGDVTSGDRAVDLAIAWSIFEPEERDEFRRAASTADAPIDDATWRRAEAWAVHFCVIYLAHSADSPALRAVGRRLAARLFPA